MKKCIKCQLEYDDKYVFCRKCGSKLEKEEEEHICPKCGQIVNTDGEYCPYCGTVITDKKERIEIPIASEESNTKPNVDVQKTKSTVEGSQKNENKSISTEKIVTIVLVIVVIFGGFLLDKVSNDKAFRVKLYEAGLLSLTAEEQFDRALKFNSEENYSEAFKWLKMSAENGHFVAQEYLGDMYYFGRGVEKNYKEALKWFLKSASGEHGNADAEYSIGYMYYFGQGVEKDYKEAFKWFLKSAEKNHREAEYEVGKCYFYGNGVSKDIENAKKWLKKSADSGHEKAKNLLLFIN